VGGAVPGKVFLDLLRQAGFSDSEIVCETGLNSSELTKGVLFKAEKPIHKEKSIMSGMDDYQAFFQKAYAEGALDKKTKHLIALGASLGAGCDP
jgi:alkylhydroperoxidase/carboxymuconolactone decarboxylase family protein YurZ